MPGPGVELLSEAVARNAAAVISLPTGGELHHHKTRFLGQSPNGIWLESVAGQDHQIQAIIEAARPVGVSFRGEPHRVAFCSRIIRSDNEFRLNAEHRVPALLLALPEEVTPIQRRRSYRVTVPIDSELRLRIWRIVEHAYIKERPAANLEVPCLIRNVSVGGIGVMMQSKPERPLRLTLNERLRLELVYRDIDFIVEGRLRHPERMPDDPPPGGVYVGIQFAKLENNLEGRQMLASINSIIGELQREEVRRTRLSVLEG